MPVKFSPSFKEFKRGSKQTTIKHDYIKQKSKDDLFEYINKEGAKPKVRRKAIIELERRGIKIEWNQKPKDILD